MNVETKPETGNRKPESKESANGSNGNTPPTQVQEIPLAEILRSPFNRTIETKKDPEFDELVESIRQHGVIQPGVARPLHVDIAAKPGTPRVELVIGERRWLGSKAAGRPTMPLIVRQLTDLEAIELQTIENDKRQDLNPLEEAEKYQQLIDQYVKAGASQEKAMIQLCAKLSKGKSTVYEALRLLKLPAEVKAAVKEGKLPPSHAGLIARLDDAPELQRKLIGLVAPHSKTDEADVVLECEFDMYEFRRDENGVLSFRDTKELVDDQAKLSSAQQAWQAAAKAHQEKGGELMDEDQMLKSISSYGHSSNGYVGGDDYTYDYNNGAKYSVLMGKHVPKLPLLAHTAEYKIVKCYRKKDAEAAIEKNGHKKKSRNGGSRRTSSTNSVSSEQERKEKAKTAARVVSAATELLLEGAMKQKPKFPWGIFTGWLAGAVGANYGPESKAILNRHGWKPVKVYNGIAKAIGAGASKLPENKIPGLLIELLLGDEASQPFEDDTGKYDETFLALCKHYGVDLAKLTKELAPAPEKPKAEKKPHTTVAKKKVQTPGRKKAKKR